MRRSIAQPMLPGSHCPLASNCSQPPFIVSAVPPAASERFERELGEFVVSEQCPRCGRVLQRGHRRHLQACPGALQERPAAAAARAEPRPRDAAMEVRTPARLKEASLQAAEVQCRILCPYRPRRRIWMQRRGRISTGACWHACPSCTWKASPSCLKSQPSECERTVRVGGCKGGRPGLWEGRRPPSPCARQTSDVGTVCNLRCSSYFLAAALCRFVVLGSASKNGGSLAPTLPLCACGLYRRCSCVCRPPAVVCRKPLHSHPYRPLAYLHLPRLSL